ncbi:hypothetical protein [Clostridium beijerinckii]|nr:hypothetical protein [Clostridium beijerinckii]NOW04515.1 hypothetical protein [Clostridium beijerinckii]NRT35457.1 hypothetical protein [Clostridium beijerinckii]NRT45115.1 hypothetical protein [Clostridium beijerinckii]NRU38831.1 hypothetical protein [Clostridium beijerinckii]NRZ20889.1 hypothetical protein [Clostridium beijerinckii]
MKVSDMNYQEEITECKSMNYSGDKNGLMQKIVCNNYSKLRGKLFF